jgi:hypothetical protein
MEGVHRARVMLAVLCVIIVAFALFLPLTGLEYLVAMLSVIAVVLLFLPSANVFFRPPDLPE